MPLFDRLPRLAELAVSGARRAGSLGIAAARELADGVRRRRDARDGAPAPASAPQQQQPPPSDAAPGPAAAAQPVSPIRPAAGEPAADHVDREAVVVAESHDPGAERAVGAQITIDEPWDGFDELRPEQVVAALQDASPETLAVVRLYEQLHRGDTAVLEAADRRLAALDE